MPPRTADPRAQTNQMAGHGKVHGVGHTIREHKKSGEDVTRQRGKKQIQESRPLRPVRHTRPGLNNRPPEQKPRAQERRLFDGVPHVGAQRQRQQRRHVPPDERQRSNRPAQRWPRQDQGEPLRERPLKPRAEHDTDRSWQAMPESQPGFAQQDERVELRSSAAGAGSCGPSASGGRKPRVESREPPTPGTFQRGNWPRAMRATALRGPGAKAKPSTHVPERQEDEDQDHFVRSRAASRAGG